MSDSKDIVRRGYDSISREYRDDRGFSPGALPGERLPSGGYDAWLTELVPLLSPGDPILDLGCGCGVPATASLAERFVVTGVDISPVQIERARQLVPKASFLCEDMSAVDFADGSFTAIVSFYAIIHLPLHEQPGLFRKAHRWLKPGGHLLATVGATAWTGTDDNWHGAPMYWSHADRDTYLQWLAAAGFDIERTVFIPEGGGGHTLVLARRSL